MWMNQQKNILREISKRIIETYDKMEDETRQREQRSFVSISLVSILFTVNYRVQNGVLGVNEEVGQGC